MAATQDPFDTFRLDGRVALVSGGGGGIGAAIAVTLAQAGAKIAIGDRDQQRLDGTAQRVGAAGAECVAFAADVTREADAERLVAAAVDRFGRLDIIVNAVGGGAGKVLYDAQDYPREAWDWIMELNLRSTLVATQPAVRAMIAGGQGGRVLNLSSVRGQLAIPLGYAAYVASKGAINALTRQWATEWARYGITVNAIAPTFTATPNSMKFLGDPDFKSNLVNRIPMGRSAETGDLVGAALFFVSAASSFVTGQVLTIDGGLTATQ